MIFDDLAGKPIAYLSLFRRSDTITLVASNGSLADNEHRHGGLTKSVIKCLAKHLHIN
jgi:hypothetical protein